MFGTGWSVVLTIVMVIVGGYCLRAWTKRYGDGAATADPAQLVHINHAVMSVLMLLMIWRPAGQIGSWVQAAIFAGFAIALLMQLPAARSITGKVDAGTHVVMNVAMAWMLLAMPLLMGASGSGANAHAEHGGAGAGDAPMEIMPTPAWTESINIAIIVACVAIAGWWVVRLVRSRSHRVHNLCHALGAGGMALMLVLM